MKLLVAVTLLSMTHLATAAADSNMDVLNCPLDDGFEYCRTVNASAADKTTLKRVFMIFQCQDLCLRLKCDAFDFHVDYNTGWNNRFNCRLYHGNVALNPAMSNCTAINFQQAFIRPPERIDREQYCNKDDD